jgi:flavorubredoxin
MPTITPRPVGYDPVEICPDTFLIRTALTATHDTMTMYQSSMLIRGAEPIIVDTGPAAASDVWLDTVFGLVDPGDVRWVFVSHNDSDHNGNLLAVLAACPRATLITTSPAVARMTSSFDLPYRRMRWLNFGDTFDAGDRTIEIFDVPVYDSPVTQGLFDQHTGAMWAVDAFAAVVPTLDAPAYAADMPQPMWERVLSDLGVAANPWLEGVSADWFEDRLAEITRRDPTVIATAHGPALTGPNINRAVDLYAALPGTTPPHGPDQHALCALLADVHQ